MARTNDFKTCGAGRERELGFGLQGKKKKKSGALPPGRREDLHPEAQRPRLRQTDNYLENDILWKQRTHPETPEFLVAASSKYSQAFWTH